MEQDRTMSGKQITTFQFRKALKKSQKKKVLYAVLTCQKRKDVVAIPPGGDPSKLQLSDLVHPLRN